MALAIQTDLILDVVRAADPQRAAGAARRLEALAVEGTAAARVGGPAPHGAHARSFASVMSTSAPPHAVANGSTAGRPATATSQPPEVAAVNALGALIVQKMIEQMTPKASAFSFGSGTAGSIWRSTLAEKLAQAVAPAIFDARALRLPAQDRTRSTPEATQA